MHRIVCKQFVDCICFQSVESRRANILHRVEWFQPNILVLGKLPVLGRPTSLVTLLYPFSPLSPSLWETARYRLKYCLKGPLNPKQPTNQNPTSLEESRARAYCACSRCGRGRFGLFFSHLSFLFFLPLSGRRPNID